MLPDLLYHIYESMYAPDPLTCTLRCTNLRKHMIASSEQMVEAEYNIEDNLEIYMDDDDALRSMKNTL